MSRITTRPQEQGNSGESLGFDAAGLVRIERNRSETIDESAEIHAATVRAWQRDARTRSSEPSLGRKRVSGSPTERTDPVQHSLGGEVPLEEPLSTLPPGEPAQVSFVGVGHRLFDGSLQGPGVVQRD